MRQFKKLLNTIAKQKAKDVVSFRAINDNHNADICIMDVSAISRVLNILNDYDNNTK